MYVAIFRLFIMDSFLLINTNITLILLLKHWACNPTPHFSYLNKIFRSFFPIRWHRALPTVWPHSLCANNPVFASITPHTGNDHATSMLFLRLTSVLCRHTNHKLPQKFQIRFLPLSGLNSDAPCIHGWCCQKRTGSKVTHHLLDLYGMVYT